MSQNFVKANVSINFDGEAEVGFSLEGNHYKINLPHFDTDFHEFDAQGDDFYMTQYFEGTLKAETLADWYDEFDETNIPPELLKFKNIG